MAWLECDICKQHTYTDENPFVEMRIPRPSDPSDMCCVLAGHKNCVGAAKSELPQITESGGAATVEQWEKWIETKEARSWGFLFLG